MQEKRTHTRVPAKAIHETPANGVFITKNDLRNYGAFAGLFFLLLSAFAVPFWAENAKRAEKTKKRKRGEKTKKTGNAEVSPCQAVSFSLYY